MLIGVYIYIYVPLYEHLTNKNNYVNLKKTKPSASVKATIGKYLSILTINARKIIQTTALSD
jgi:uncharacterized membrane protein YjfL (UPF0719 family)